MSSEKPQSIIHKLARKWQEGTITPEEKILFNEWYDSFEEDDMEQLPQEQLKKRMYWNILEKEAIPVQRQNSPRWWFVAAAVTFGVFVSFGGYLLLKNKGIEPVPSSALSQAADIPPGQNKAMLTLADGSKITLNDAKNGILANQGDLYISKDKDGQVIYHASKSGTKTRGPVFNEISIPRGGQFQVNLPDGTKVWLNSASTLKFPLAFNKDERRVELTGEAYFEVKHQASSKHKSGRLPFIVSSRGQQIEVLGTHFNVNAYPDENDVKTTLLEGAVKVVQLSTNQSRVLKPGQQSVMNTNISVFDVDANQAIEWQKGYFSFENETLENIMRTISRWYDVDIELEDGIRYRRFGGRISKFENISQILKIMEKTKVIHFKIEERRVIVMP
ncbi:putative anti-sigma factor [Pedobacter sp. BAL39]|uniref:FecR domain-containing protein n=1 Tax=Pedobacter sp. BAL39 TaxID=391596 RepID=UPI0001559BBB|nr:FecR domain-containing protein [Pedobacter sp. BAL39]EDM37349.1 putative anti-sigma factor [Pedobacter sp. BAL39]